MLSLIPEALRPHLSFPVFPTAAAAQTKALEMDPVAGQLTSKGKPAASEQKKKKDDGQADADRYDPSLPKWEDPDSIIVEAALKRIVREGIDMILQPKY